ncbi:MAG: exodeoxyribonuclease III [Spirochaetaceae bacterium]
MNSQPHTIVSWNVNGIRAAVRNGFIEWITGCGADVVCIQETKAHPDQLTEELLTPAGYSSYFANAEKRGYSGTAIFSRTPPDDVSFLGEPDFDSEGRVLIETFGSLSVVNAYFPNSQEAGKRLSYKLAFCEAVKARVDSLVQNGQDVVLCGDYNIAHTEIDLARPKQNEKNPGYLPEERAWMSSFLGAGYVDTFRMFETGANHYTWWSYRGGARTKNVGWRIDYHCVNEGLRDRVKASLIHPDIGGSDHCPVSITLG